MDAQLVDIQNEELYEFMVDHLGGETKVEELRKEKEMEKTLLNQTLTLGEILDKAEEGNWFDWLKEQKLSRLTKPRVRHKREGTSRSRITKAEKEQIREGILQYLKVNPGSAVSAIANTVGWSTKIVGNQIRPMRYTGLITKEGERKTTRYWLKETN